jgi:hypothetical protein
MNIPGHLRALKPGMAEALGHYVYLYIDPRDEKVFYVGKGKGERCLDHLFEDDDHPKVQRIRDIFAAGLEPRIEILAHGMKIDDEAYLVEAAAIDLIGLHELTNKVLGHNSLLYGRKSLKELEVFYAPTKGDITHPVMLITINNLFRNGMSALELYEATRGIWRNHSLDRLAGVKYVCSVFEGVVKEVYEPELWRPAQASGYETRATFTPEDLEGRFEFVGKLAPDDIRKRYIDKSVRDYIMQGSQNPCRYVNC